MNFSSRANAPSAMYLGYRMRRESSELPKCNVPEKQHLPRHRDGSRALRTNAKMPVTASGTQVSMRMVPPVAAAIANRDGKGQDACKLGDDQAERHPHGGCP